MSNVESETLDYLEVTSRVQSKKVPAPKGNRMLIKRKVDKEYTPLENGDDLLVIQSQEELTLLPAMSENWLIKVIFICSSMIWVIYSCFISFRSFGLKRKELSRAPRARFWRRLWKILNIWRKTWKILS